MSLLQVLTDLFDSIFRSSSPEVQKKQKLKKLDQDLRINPNEIYRNELVQPNFAEAMRVLAVSLKPIAAIIDNTIGSPDIKRNRRFESELIITGYSDELKAVYDSLLYERRKQEVAEAGENASRIYDEQHRRLEKLVHELNSPEFKKMDDVIAKLHQLIDLCHFNFTAPIQLFDSDFSMEETQNNFQALPIQTVEGVLADLYYVLEDFSITMPVANAIIALQALLTGQEVPPEQRKDIISNLRHVEGITKRILNGNTLRTLLCIAKKEPDYNPQHASYKATSRKNFSQALQDRYAGDELRIKGELKDEHIKEELNTLFGDGKLEELNGYNADLAQELGQNISTSFMWVTPMRILKTFLKQYYTEGVKAVINDIVVEGFFSNSAYKTQFSGTFFAANECMDKILKFEAGFNTGAKNDVAVIKGLIRDSHKNPDFSKKLMTIVDAINSDAKQMIQKELSVLLALYKEIGGIFQDSKKAASEIASNLKTILMSSRNRDNTLKLENQYHLWGNFFEIMKNYAIISSSMEK